MNECDIKGHDMSIADMAGDGDICSRCELVCDHDYPAEYEDDRQTVDMGGAPTRIGGVSAYCSNCGKDITELLADRAEAAEQDRYEEVY